MGKSSNVLMFITGRIATKRQTAGITFTHRPKIGFFRPTGATHCTDSGQTWQSRRAPESAWLCQISPQWTQGWECGPKISKISTFGKESLAGL